MSFRIIPRLRVRSKSASSFIRAVPASWIFCAVFSLRCAAVGLLLAFGAVLTLSAQAQGHNTVPVLIQATVEGNGMLLNYTKDLDSEARPATTDFEVMVTPLGGTATQRTITSVHVSEHYVLLWISPVVRTDSVTVSYFGSSIRDLGGNYVATFMNISVINNTVAVPGAPQNLSASAGDGKVMLTWRAPVDRGGGAITRYEYRINSGIWTSSGRTLSVTATGLTNGTSYTFEVRAVNSAGAGEAETVTATPAATVPIAGDGGTTTPGTISDAPLYLRATPGNEQATLTWNAPYYNGGAEIIGYSYRYKQGDQTLGFDALRSWKNIPDGANARSYTVTNLTNGLEYTFEVRAENVNGGGIPARATVRLPVTVNVENEELPTEVALMANYPNPFNPETTIGYMLPQVSEVRLVVYDLLGHEMVVLVDGLQPAGRHTVRFVASDLPSDSYVYRLQAGNKVITRSMMLVK